MQLTLSKRFEFAASARTSNPRWSPSENAAYYGPRADTAYGVGNNYTVYIIFTGPVDLSTGMMINVSLIKERVGDLLEQRYDHKFLNVDTPPFDQIPPTAENIARMLLLEVSPLFNDTDAKPYAVHLQVSPLTSATAYADGRFERSFWLEFSAARRTYSPNLSDDENTRLFGIAASKFGHGHNYRLRVTVGGQVDPQKGLLVPYTERVHGLQRLRTMLDHKNLNEEVAELSGWPITTESLARFTLEQLAAHMPVAHVRLYEMSWFFAEYCKDKRVYTGVERAFHATHRLNNPAFSELYNSVLYGKCNHPSGHGHMYRIEATIGGKLDERSGTLIDLGAFHKSVGDVLEPWAFKHLDAEVEDFQSCTSTGENIINLLWPKLNHALDDRMHRLRLWETPNNRFTLRKIF